ncbi:MAG: hypothetical protein CME59_13735 [Halioglobus sp.]|nr:hypothetical protein [Halioglobus sp.]|tara:strand:+ start:462 stop:1328 length:867 start_codon:yes stop_codon:yes gene_type:complete
MSDRVEVIDTHVHIVAQDEQAYPLNPAGLPGAWYREAPYSAEAFIDCMHDAGVDRAVLVQPVGAYSFDNRYTADSMQAHPGLFAGACCVDVNGPQPGAELRHWLQERGMQGVRLFALDLEGPGWLAEPVAQPLWECAAELGAHVIVTIFPHQFPQLRAMLQRYPQVRVSMDHCGFPPVNGPPWSDSAALTDLVEYDNLYLKVTSHVFHSVIDQGYHPSQWVQHLVSHFGADRLMWGSDFSQTHGAGYVELVVLAREAFAGLPAADRDLCMGGTAARLWPVLQPAAAVP